LASHTGHSLSENFVKKACGPGERWHATPLVTLQRAHIPTELHFVRDHFGVPAVDPDSWSLRLGGDERSLVFDLDGLKALPRRTVNAVFECAGHRRVEFDPLPPGVAWGIGAVAEATWTGVSLASLIELAGLPPQAREVVLEGADAGPVDGFEGVHRFARSLPLAKARERDVLLAYEMNGEPIPVDRGGPVRAVVPGWYATDSVKWLDRIWFAEAEFDGVFQAHDYRLRRSGQAGPAHRMTVLPIHALLTTPADGDTLTAGETLIRGIAWGGSGGVAEVRVRIDAGAWTAVALHPSAGPYARTVWELGCRLSAGRHELACRAGDGMGALQPDRPVENLDGYANNAVHRVRVTVR
jgi:DMSO/TMAO reductase YedYZ molybdopterin-dependent catalytic subunit